jgi:hypothetical protein
VSAGSVAEHYGPPVRARFSFHHKCAPLPHRIPTLDPPRRIMVLRCVRDAHFHHDRAPLQHQIVTLDPPRSITVLRCVRRAHYHFPWLSLAAPGCPWTVPGLLLGCSWLLLAAPGLLLAAPGLLLPGCSWLPLAAPGCLWLLLMSTVYLKKTTCLGSYAGIIPVPLVLLVLLVLLVPRILLVLLVPQPIRAPLRRREIKLKQTGTS